MPKNRANLAGKKYGMLSVLSLAHVHKKQTYWLCECECGNTKVIPEKSLSSGATISCGCVETKNRQKIKSRSEKNLFDNTNVSRIRSTRPAVNNKSGIRGVCRAADGKWIAYITLRGLKHRRYFSVKEDAIAWRKEMEKKLFSPVIEEYNKLIGSQAKEGGDTAQ